MGGTTVPPLADAMIPFPDTPGGRTMTGDRATCRRPEQKQAFNDLLNKVDGELRGCIQHLVGSRDATDDIVHDTYLKAWSSATFDPEHVHARAWIFTTAKRLVRDLLESGESKTGNRGDLSELTVDPKARDPLDELIKKAEKRILHAALARLNEDDRKVITLYYLDEVRPQHKLAVVMRISLPDLNNRLSRARKRLQLEILRGRSGEDGDGYDPY
jgi:RNA polymerase sigma-70 factor (ECF subfamily)